jgi:hypothetical protein
MSLAHSVHTARGGARHRSGIHAKMIISMSVTNSIVVKMVGVVVGVVGGGILARGVMTARDDICTEYSILYL